MRMTVSAIVLILSQAAVAVAPATRPATRPATAPAAAAAADRWLDRAAADLRAALEQPLEPGMHSDFELAIALVRTRGNDVDRALLRDILQRPPRPQPPPADPDLIEFSVRCLAAMGYAALGETEAARDAARAAEEASAKAAASKNNLFGVIVPGLMEAMWVEIGDADAARAVALKRPFLGDTTSALVALSGRFDDAGMTDARDAALRDATQMALAEKDPINSASGLKQVAQQMTRQGRLDDAQALIEQMPAEFPRCDAWLDLARARHDAGDAAGTSAALAAAQATVDAMSFGYQVSFYPSVAHAAAELGDRDAVARAADAAEAKLASEPPYVRSRELARLARDRAAVGDVIGMERLAKDVEAAIAKTPEAAPEDRSRPLLGLASAFARTGQVQRSDEALARAAAILPPEHYNTSEYFDDLLASHIFAGNDAHAMALAKGRSFDDDDLDSPRFTTIRRDLLRRDFAAARRTADAITSPSRRIRAYGSIALAQARAGQSDAAANWIATLPAPQPRALLYLLLAQHTFGDEHRGLVRLMRGT